MAPKRPATATSMAFDNDDISIMEVPTFAKAPPKRGNRAVDTAQRDDGSKHQKLTSSHVSVDKTTGDKLGATKRGLCLRPQLMCLAVRLTPSMVEGQQLGHGSLILGVKVGNCGEPHFYSGLSSSVETDIREESYRIAPSLGAASDAHMACGFNFC